MRNICSQTCLRFRIIIKKLEPRRTTCLDAHAPPQDADGEGSRKESHKCILDAELLDDVLFPSCNSPAFPTMFSL